MRLLLGSSFAGEAAAAQAAAPRAQVKQDRRPQEEGLPRTYGYAQEAEATSLMPRSDTKPASHLLALARSDVEELAEGCAGDTAKKPEARVQVEMIAASGASRELP